MANITKSRVRSWLDYQHPEYKENAPRWQFALDHYTGDVVRPDKIKQYLIKREIGESAEAYRERTRLVDHGGHFAQIADSLAGMIFSVEDDANRTWADDSGAGLGDPQTAGSISARLLTNADGKGAGWGTLWRRLAIQLVVMQGGWLMIGQRDGRATGTVISPLAVSNWVEDEDGIAEVMLVEHTAGASSLTEEQGTVERFTVLNRGGWQRYQRGSDGGPMALNGPGDSGTYSYVDRYGRPTLPIMRVTLPMDRQVGYLMAMRANVLLNKASHLDNLLRTANFPYFLATADDELFASLTNALAKGAKVLQVMPGETPHSFIAPPTDSAAISSTSLQDAIKDFYITSFREYGASAGGTERTATEVRSDIATGVGAFLSLLSSALDDAENAAFHLIAQTEIRNNPTAWTIPRVERSREFAPSDVQTVIDNTIRRVFGTDVPVPLGKKGQMASAMQLANYLGVSVDENELEATLEVANIQKSLELMKSLPIPKAARVALAMRLLKATGVMDAAGTVTMADGTVVPILQAWTDEAEQVAEAQEQAMLRAGEFAAYGSLGGVES